MRPNPSIDELNRNPQLPNSTPPYDIDLVMSGALKLDMTFRIDIPNGTRVMPSTVYLGHDSDYLYVGGEFHGMYINPASTSERTRPNAFSILFDVTNDGVLTYSESGSRLAAYVSSTGPRARFYNDMVWAYLSQDKHSAWITAENYYALYLQKAQPASPLKNDEMEYDIPTGTVTILFSRYLGQPSSSEFNALQMRQGERWVMSFFLELRYITNGVYPYDFVDGWPRNTYPYTSDDSSWWPKLVIDLANPPANV